MRLDFELKNYRCFPDSHPARFSLGRQLVAFIGVNNSGKSTLLRSFYELRQLFGFFSGPTGNLLNMLRGQKSDRVNFQGVQDQEEAFSNLNDRDIELRLTLDLDQAGEEVPLAEQQPPVPEQLLIHIERGDRFVTFEVIEPAGFIVSDDMNWQGNTLVQGGTPALDFTPWFEWFRWLSASLYLGPFRNAINAGAGSYYDLNVGTAFIGQWDQYKAGPTKSHNRAALQLTSEIQRIFQLRSLDINAQADNLSLQVIIDGQPYRLEEVGGGLAHFIIVLASAATRTPPFILIDEPELNLHPSLQLDFLVTLASYAQQGVVFATHSIGLARAAGELVYSVRGIESGVSELRELEGTPRLAEFLGELSLSGYQELGFNKVLLVEGPKDVAALQRLLRLYQIEHEVVLLPLGGGTLINGAATTEAQLEEIKRITPNIFALIDSEKESDGDELDENRVAFVAVCERVGITCRVLDRRALENYFTDRAVKDIKGENYRALEAFERLKDTDVPWAKDENWRIAGAMHLDELQDTDLHVFLESLRV
jgi:ABC-type cobalamin/Fe3+-siderophores transport system ATPase subunit